MKSNTFKEYIAPVVVLVAICLVITTALAFTYSVANPIIVANNKKAADEARVELLADADAFTQYEGEMATVDKATATEVYTANNGAGAVITVQTSSFGGALTMMVGIDGEGKVTGVKVTNHADTPGVGTKNWDSGNRNHAYDGAAEMTSTSVKNAGVEYVTGASVTGQALHVGVCCALEQFKLMGGAK